jgi:hypothetical protein
MHALTKCSNSRIDDRRVRIFVHARGTKDENGGDAVVDTDLGIALVGNRPVRARKQERMACDGDGGDVRSIERIFVAKLEAGVDCGMQDAARIGAIGVA